MSGLLQAVAGVVGGVSPTTIISAAALWEGATGSFTLTTPDVDANTFDVAIQVIVDYTGDLSVDFTVDTIGSCRFGVYDTTESGTFNQNNGTGGMASMTNSWDWEMGSGIIAYGGATQATGKTVANTDTVKLERVGSTVSFYKDTGGGPVLQHAFTQTFAGELTIVAANGGTSWNTSDVSWTN